MFWIVYAIPRKIVRKLLERQNVPPNWTLEENDNLKNDVTLSVQKSQSKDILIKLVDSFYVGQFRRIGLLCT